MTQDDTVGGIAATDTAMDITPKDGPSGDGTPKDGAPEVGGAAAASPATGAAPEVAKAPTVTAMDITPDREG